MLTRRKALFGLLAAPAIIRTPGLLMHVPRRKSYGNDINYFITASLSWEYNTPCDLEYIRHTLIDEISKAAAIPRRYLEPPIVSNIEKQEAINYFAHIINNVRVA